ncbi:GAF domain-containing protein [Kallotenue papyrolyticum]|uniref:GAF domain-containing protein n=1 Tax=Kallotenue papyrolyticum TaxID=1325125 RepID=UPI0013788BDA|nr:GAF domain-containing protein [Kallotenue papyrolyticum]
MPALARAELLASIAAKINALDDLEQMLATTLAQLNTAIPFTGGSVALIDGDELVIRAAYGPFAAAALGQRMARNHGPSWRVIDTGEPFLSGDVIAEGGRPTSPFRSYLAVPLYWHDQIFGLLEIDSPAIDAFTADDRALLQTVAALLSGPIALQHQIRALKHEVAERSRAERRLSAQYRATRILAEAATFPDAAPLILRTMGELLDWDVASIWCVDHHRGQLRCTSFWRAHHLRLDDFEQATRQGALAPGEELPGRVWASGHATWISILEHERTFPRLASATSAGLQSAIAFPIRSQHELFGVVELLSQARHAPDEMLIQTLTALGEQMGQFIERRRAQIERQRSEESKSAILQAALDAIITIDHQSRILEFNPAAERIFGYRRDAVLGRTLDEVIVPPALREAHRRGMERYLATGVGNIIGKRVEMSAMRADGRQFPIELTVTRIAASDPPMFTGFIRDITERQRAEAMQRFLGQASHTLALSLDYQTTCQRIAQLVVPRLADWCLVDMLGDNETLHQLAVAHIDPSKAELARELRRRYPPNPRTRHPIWRALQTGKSILVGDVGDLRHLSRYAEAQRLLGELGTCAYMVVPLRARGRTIGAISLVAGTSGRRYTPHDLALAEELARRAALAIDNARLYEEAQAAIELRDEFLSIASHELKTPLTTLLGHIQALQRRLLRAAPPILGERDRRALSIIEAQALRLNKQISNLLDVSRLQMGQFYIEPQPMDLCALAQRVVEELEPTLERHTIRLLSEQAPLPIVGDEQRLEQVLQNLLQNALKYSPDGGTITVRLEHQGQHVVLRVSDEGIGIPETVQANLFQRFFRAPNVNERRIKGFGIGLYLIREIVARHNGSVEVSSVEGAGSTFTVRLPLSNAALPAPEGA